MPPAGPPAATSRLRLDDTVVDGLPPVRPYIRAAGDQLVSAGPVPASAGPAVACLRSIDRAGAPADQMQLQGLPAYLGTDSAWPGIQYAGVVLSDGADGLVVLDSCDTAWWNQLIEEAVTARDALLASSGTARTPA